MKNFKSIIINIALIIISVAYTIPNLISEKKELTEEYGTLHKVYVETYKYKPPKSFSYRDRERLDLITSDRAERTYKLTDHYRVHWTKFLEKSAIGKELRVYLKTDNSRTDPLLVELDKKKIYGKSSILVFSILILVLTVGFTSYNLYQIFEK